MPPGTLPVYTTGVPYIRKKELHGLSCSTQSLTKCLEISWCPKCRVWGQRFSWVHLVVTTLFTWPVSWTVCYWMHLFLAVLNQRGCFSVFDCALVEKNTPGAGCPSGVVDLWREEGCFKRSAWYPGQYFFENNIPAWPEDLWGTQNMCQVRGSGGKLQEKCVELSCIYRNYMIGAVPADPCCEFSLWVELQTSFAFSYETCQHVRNVPLSRKICLIWRN